MAIDPSSDYKLSIAEQIYDLAIAFDLGEIAVDEP